jgi:hypothetical protein
MSKNIWDSFNFGEKLQIDVSNSPNTQSGIREMYLKIQDWVKDKDPKKIKFLLEQNRGWNSNQNENLTNIINWYNDINGKDDETKNIIFGDIILTVDEISRRMLDHLGASGHASDRGHQSVINFFSGLKEKELLSIAYGSTQDDYEVDIDGGRSYLMGRSNIYAYVFNYIYYTKKMTFEKYQDGIFNSGDASEQIEDFFGPKSDNYETVQSIHNITLPSIDEFESLFFNTSNKKHKDNAKEYNSMINNIVSKFGSDPLLKDFVNKMKGLEATDDYVDAKIREFKIDKVVNKK